MNQTRRILARCPRCHGRLLLEQDRRGTYLYCVACGNVLEEHPTAAWRSTGQMTTPGPPFWWRAQPA